MLYFTTLVTLFCILAGALTFHAIKTGGNRLALVSIFTGMVFFGLAVATDILGLSKPLSLEWRSVQGMPVVAIHYDEDTKQLFLWALRDGTPRAYSLVIKDEDEAEDVQRKFYASRTEGTRMELQDGPFLNYRFREGALPATKEEPAP